MVLSIEETSFWPPSMVYVSVIITHYKLHSYMLDLWVQLPHEGPLGYPWNIHLNLNIIIAEKCYYLELSSQWNQWGSNSGSSNLELTELPSELTHLNSTLLLRIFSRKLDSPYLTSWHVLHPSPPPPPPTWHIITLFPLVVV